MLTPRSFRFPVSLPVLVKTRHETVFGRTVNMSSTGIKIQLSTLPRFSKDSRFSVEIEWPVKIDKTVSLKLHADVKFIRQEDDYLVFKVLKHEFRTRRSKPAIYPINLTPTEPQDRLRAV